VEARVVRPGVVPEGCVEEGALLTWRKEMEGERPGSAAQTTGGGGGEVLYRRRGPLRRRGIWVEEERRPTTNRLER
jgi:hypothetical protein